MKALCNNNMDFREFDMDDMRDTKDMRDMKDMRDTKDMRDMRDMNMQQRDSLMIEIMKYQFATLDTALFLNTHPNDPIALIRHHEYSTRLMQLKDEFGKKFGPLDSYTPDASGTWRYIDSPWPWE